MQNRDSYQRQTGLLHKQGATAPLHRSTKPLLDPATLRAQAEDMLAKADESLANLEPRIELLLHGCQRAGLTVPGLGEVAFKSPLSPKGEQIVTYLVSIFTDPNGPAREVQVGVFRFYDAARAVMTLRAVMETGALEQEMLEALRLKLFYLTRYHVDFKGDRVLAQLFPPPQTVAQGVAKVPGSPMSTVERLKQKQAREAVLHKAEILRAGLAPKMEIARLTVQMIEQPKGLNIGSLFTPTTRTARLLTIGLGGQPELVNKLREAIALFGRLETQLADARKGADVEPLKQTIYPLGRLAVDCHKHPLLKEVFPLAEQDLFPEEAEPKSDPGPR